jgi:hypothetical protein
MPTCNVCSKETANNKGLSYHCSIAHGMKFVDYVLKFDLAGVWPLCQCGCGEKVKFLNGRFMSFFNGHQCLNVPKSEEHCKKISDAARGRVLTPEWKENIRITTQKNFDEGHGSVEKMIAAIRGKKQTAEHRKKLSVTRSARLASGEIVINRDKISETIARKYVDGEFNFKRGHHLSPKTGLDHYHRSSWELRHMHDMDSDPVVTTYLNEPFSIPYEWEGSRHRYVPDFVVTYSDGHRELHEVGVKKLKDSPRSLAKQRAAEQYCLDHGLSFRVVSF